MRGVLPNYRHYYIIFFFLFLVFALFRPVLSINTLSSQETLTTLSNRSLVSLGDVYELGFFKTATNSDLWYLGIWYKTIPERTYVWVANRDNPLSNSTGTLKIFYNNLVLLDQYDNLVWSTNLTGAMKSSPVVAELLANGNLVLRDSKTNDPERFLWQSFDFPVDTLLPGMKLGWDSKTGYNRFLTSWKSPTDPSTGDLTFKLETGELPEFYLLKNEKNRLYRTGPWDGIRFNGIPSMQNSCIDSNFIENREEVAYSFKVTNQSIHSRLTISASGLLQMFTRFPKSPEWNMFWNLPMDECDTYQKCGPYSYCDQNTSPVCNCIKGFFPKNNMTAWALGEDFDGCVRKTPLCGGHGDGFYLMKNMKLPETSSVIVDRGIGLKECQERCFRDCNCTGFASADIRSGGSGCVIWTGELVDIRKYDAEGEDLYVKLAAATRRVDISFKLSIYYMILICIIMY